MNLSFFLVNDTWVNEFRRKLKDREIAVRVLLDLTANQTIDDDPYLLLAKEVKRQRGHVIDDPDLKAYSAHKARFHQMLVQNQIPVPETIMVGRNELNSFDHSGNQGPSRGAFCSQTSLGGLWRRGGHRRRRPALVGRADTELRHFPDPEEASACGIGEPYGVVSHVSHLPGGYTLLVEPGQPRVSVGNPGPDTKLQAAPLRSIMRGIARISKMKKFTSEICLHQDGNFYAVDYVNADPDMNPRSFYPNGVPDEVVRHVVWLLFYEDLHMVKRGHGFSDD